MVAVACGSGRLRELFITEFKRQVKRGSTMLVVTRAGRLREWSQGELLLHLNQKGETFKQRLSTNIDLNRLLVTQVEKSISLIFWSEIGPRQKRAVVRFSKYGFLS